MKFCGILQNYVVFKCVEKKSGVIVMELEWLWLIIPGAYIALSTLFFCLPNILHRRHQYSSQLFNQLVEAKEGLVCIAHRGGGFEGVENTMQVFRASRKNCHEFELDVCLTKDGQIVVNHDTDLKRTCGVAREVRDLNFAQLPPFAEEYQTYGGGMMQTTRNKIPLLSELFEEFPDTHMNIELKAFQDEAIAELDRLIRKYKREHITFWGATDGSICARMREVNPKIVNFYSTIDVVKVVVLFLLGLLPFVCLRPGILEIPLVTDEMKRMFYKEAGSGCEKCLLWVQFVFQKLFNLLSHIFIPHLKKRGILTFYWIVNEDKDYETAVATGCSGIISDRPSRLAHFLKTRNLYFNDIEDTSMALLK